MKRTLLLFAIVVIGLPITALADTLTFQAPVTAANQGNGGPKQVDLDHHSAYTWRIDDNRLAGKTITSATISISNISNWDRNANMLFIHLLDTAKAGGITSFADATGVPVPSSQIRDNFEGALYNSNPLVAPGTRNTFLTSQSFTTNPSTFVYNFFGGATTSAERILPERQHCTWTRSGLSFLEQRHHVYRHNQ